MYDMLATTPLLVVGSATGTINEFLGTGIGKLIAGGMSIAGFLILLFAVFKAVKDILGGKVGGAVKSIAGGAIIAAVLLFPGPTLGGLIDLANSVVTQFTGSINEQQLTELSNNTAVK